MKYTEKDIGNIVDYSDDKGSYYEMNRNGILLNLWLKIYWAERQMVF